MVSREHCCVCGSHRTQPLYRPQRSPGPVVRCRGCGFTYVSPVEDDRALINDGPVLRGDDPAVLSSTDLNDLEGSWESQIFPEKQAELPALRRNANDALQRIARFVQPPGRLLDFGCGWGFFLAEAQRSGWEPYGLEPLPAPAIYARVHAGATVVSDTLRAESFPERFFDVITSFQVFEHLPEPDAVLAQLARLLCPGGLILIEVPNINTWSVRLLGKRHRHYVQDHLNFFSGQTLGQLMERHGLRVVDAYYPIRQMSLRHLLVGWGGRLLPAQFAAAASRLPQRLLDTIVPIRLGDIVSVVAQRPLAG